MPAEPAPKTQGVLPPGGSKALREKGGATSAEVCTETRALFAEVQPGDDAVQLSLGAFFLL